MDEKLTAVERVFKFEDEAFRAYMARVQRRSPSYIKECGDGMAESDHPVVQYAAGWAAVEHALFRDNPNSRNPMNVSYDKRVVSLATASARWDKAAVGLQDMRQSQSTIQRQLRFFGLEMRLMEAMAYMPNMEIDAALLGRGPLSDDERQLKLGETKQRTSHLARYVMGMSNVGHIGQIRAGLISEMACGAVGQSIDDGRYIFIPSTFRQDHHLVRNMRADYVAMSGKEPYPKTLVQVKKVDEVKYNTLPNFCNVLATRDLILHPGRPVTETLGAFADIVEGQGKLEDEDRMTRLAGALALRLDDCQGPVTDAVKH